MCDDDGVCLGYIFVQRKRQTLDKKVEQEHDIDGLFYVHSLFHQFPFKPFRI